MRKLFTLLCGMLFAAQFTTVSAQSTTKMKVYKTDGSVVEYSTSEVDSVSFSTSSPKEDLGGGIYRINGHRFVDLGLPSGLLWAETNIGAESAADDGNYYAWGETETKSSYTWDTYEHSTSTKEMTRYNATDGTTVLEKEDDAAYVNWGAFCRMPTNDELAELCNSGNCTWTWTTQTNSSGTEVSGYKVTSVKNENSIFLPASGYLNGIKVESSGSYGFYWISSLYTGGSNFDNACDLMFTSSRPGSTGCTSRYYGFPIRPVAEK